MGWWKDKLGIDTSSLIGVTSGLIPYSSSKQREAAKDAQADRLKGLKAAERLQQEGIDQARADINRLFPQAIETARGGYQGALDVFGQSLPAQTQAFQQGNMGAQQQILAGLPLAQAAILGGQIDYSALQPYQAQIPDLGFFQQTLPSLQEQRQQQQRPQEPMKGLLSGRYGSQFSDYANAGLAGQAQPRFTQQEITQTPNNFLATLLGGIR